MNLNETSEKPILWSYTLILLVSFVIIYFQSHIWYFSKKNNTANGNHKNKVLGLSEISGPKPVLPTKLIGNVPQLWPSSIMLPQLLKWGQAYPDIIKLSGLNKSIVGLISPDVIQQLFKSQDLCHGVKTPVVYEAMKPFIINGVLVSKGKMWQTQRKILIKTQSFQNLKAYMGMINNYTQQFVNDLEELFKDGKPHTINASINILFLSVICEMITGSNSNSPSELYRYHCNFEIWKELQFKRLLHPWLILDFLWKLHPSSNVQHKAIEEMCDFAKAKIKEHKETKGAEPNKKTTETPTFKSMIDVLLEAGVQDAQIVDEVNTMIFGGHETGATAIHFFCLMMSLNPEMQEHCRKEVDELFENQGNVSKGEISFEAANAGLKYIERCIQETMRLYPPVIVVFRQLEAPLKIEFNNNTYVLPTGCNVAISPFMTQRNAKLFPEPEKFDPDRFLPEEAAKRHACSFIPFSGGPRGCLGLKFAMIEMKVIAAYILRNFYISTQTRIEDVTLLPYTTLTPEKNFVFEFKKRNLLSSNH